MMTFTVRRTIATGLIALLAACGGSGLSKEELITQADAICADIDRQIEDIPEPESLEGVQSFADQAVPILEDGLRRLRALEPPADDREQVQAIWAEFENGLEGLRDMRAAAAAQDEQAFGAAFQRVQSSGEEGNRLARVYGFDDCAEE